MNVKKILRGGEIFTNDVFRKIKSYSQEDNEKIKTSDIVYFYDTGVIKVNNSIIYNPISNSSLFNEIKIDPSAKYNISLNKKWILYNDNGNYVLYYNTFYSPDFIDYSNGPNDSSAKKSFIKYCNLVDYKDENCNCIVASKYDGYNQDKCLEQIGIDPSKLTEYAKNELSSVCSCINSSCASIRTNGSKIFRRNCDNITVCNVSISSNESQFISPIQIAQRCGYTSEDTSGTTEPTQPTTPIEPTEPTQPTQPTDPTEPTTPTEPTEPTTTDTDTTDTTSPDITTETTETKSKDIKKFLIISLIIFILVLIFGVIIMAINKRNVKPKL